MGIKVESYIDGRVSKPGTRNLGRDVLLEHQSRIGVAKVMQPYSRKVVMLSYEVLEVAAERYGVDRLAVFPAENQAVVFVDGIK